MGIRSDLRDAINEAAQKFVSSGKDKFKSSEIRELIYSNKLEDKARFEPSFQVIFSDLTTKDPECVIRKVPGTYLYQMSSNDPSAPNNEQTPPSGGVGEGGNASPITDSCSGPPSLDTAKSIKCQRESKLYAVLRDWLASRGYQAAITATGRKGGVWGNPDVAGIRVDELPLGHISFECATIEAKLTNADWRYWLFEAVAHKRFAHRAYFAFAFGTDNPSLEEIVDSWKMCEYAEKYRIGILVVFIERDKYEKLNGSADIADIILDADDARIEVLWPAFYEAVQPYALNEYIREGLEVKSIEDYRNFGNR